jgi:hypothetical protein
MPILTNKEGRKLYVLRRISNNEVIKHSVQYSAAVDDAPLEGFDPDLEYLAMDEDVKPNYDKRFFNLVKSEGKVGNLWRITYSTIERKLTQTQIKIAVTNTEAAQIEQHVKHLERDKLVFLALGMLFAESTNPTPNQRQAAVKNRVIAIAEKLWQNYQRVRDLFTAIDGGETPDIDTGWAAAQ